MAVLVQMISVVIPIKAIDGCAMEGGFAGYRQRYKDSFGNSKWYDENLVVTVHPDADFFGMELDLWEKRGLVLVKDERWQDLCVVDQYRGPTLPCDWLAYDPREQCAWLNSAPRGTTVGPTESDVARRAKHLSERILGEAAVAAVPDRPWWKFWKK